jgi:tRNA U34 5-methylaminomethyl-2-thiouridine-forming methyltransferase MnmC
LDLSRKFGPVIKTDDGSFTLKVSELGECYHSLSGAKSEAQNLYIAGSGIQQFMAASTRSTLQVLDVGLGLGYNACATIEAWASEPTGADLRILSLEKDRNLIESLSQSSGPWQQSWTENWRSYGTQLSTTSENLWWGKWQHPTTSASIHWVVQLGDAATAKFSNPFSAPFDFVWQDPFSPAKNPDMWSKDWFEKIRPDCAPHCRLLTYSCARTVKDNLSAAGWSWTRIKGGGTKREWLMASPSEETN